MGKCTGYDIIIETWSLQGIDCYTNFFYYLIKQHILHIPVAGDSEELSASAMTPMIKDWDRVFTDVTNVTTSDLFDTNTLKLEDENSTTISVKEMKSLAIFLKL